MIVFAAVDVPLQIGLPLSGFLLLLSIWYWQRLAGEQFADSTRNLRRGTLVLGVLATFALVRAASFVDSEVAPSSYVIAWLSALGLIFLMLLLLAVDVVNSLRLHRREFLQESLEASVRLRADIEAHRSAQIDESVSDEDGGRA